MADTYTRINWEPIPSEKTPLNYRNLNIMDKGIEEAHNAIKEKINKPATAKVGQVLIVKAVDENGVPTEFEAADQKHIKSYNDLTDRPCYESKAETPTVLFEEQTVSFGPQEYDGVAPYLAELSDCEYIDTDILIIKYDGTEYKCDSITKITENGLVGYMIGATIDDSGSIIYDDDLPFYLSRIIGEGMDVVVFYSKTTEDVHTISIVKVETVHTIIQLDEKYIPESIARTSETVALPVDSESGEIQNGTAGQFAVSDGAGGITWKTVMNAEEVAY